MPNHGPLPDWMIAARRELLEGDPQRLVIEPFQNRQVEKGVISSGLGSYGYDSRCGYKFKVFTNVWGKTVDPKAFDQKAFVDIDLTPPVEGRHEWDEGTPVSKCLRCGFQSPITEWKKDRLKCHVADHIVIPPNSFALAETLEYFEIPRDVTCICLGKSTYSRCGIAVNVTPLEADWSGKVTIEISNTTPLPAKIYAGEGIMQIIFLAGAGVCQISYKDKKGKYDRQLGLTLPFVK